MQWCLHLRIEIPLYFIRLRAAQSCAGHLFRRVVCSAEAVAEVKAHEVGDEVAVVLVRPDDHFQFEAVLFGNRAELASESPLPLFVGYYCATIDADVTHTVNLHYIRLTRFQDVDEISVIVSFRIEVGIEKHHVG